MHLINTVQSLDFHPHFPHLWVISAKLPYYFSVGVFLYPLFLCFSHGAYFRNVSRFRGSGYRSGYTTNHYAIGLGYTSTLSMSLTQYAGGPALLYTVQVITQPVSGGA